MAAFHSTFSFYSFLSLSCLKLLAFVNCTAGVCQKNRRFSSNFNLNTCSRIPQKNTHTHLVEGSIDIIILRNWE